jgi:hypothetical protein
MIKKISNNTLGTTSIRSAINSSKLMQQLVASLPDKEKANTVEFLEAVLTDMDGITEKLRLAISQNNNDTQTSTEKQLQSQQATKESAHAV